MCTSTYHIHIYTHAYVYTELCIALYMYIIIMYLLDCHAMYKNCIECKERIVYREYSEYYLRNHRKTVTLLCQDTVGQCFYSTIYTVSIHVYISLRHVTLSSDMYIKRFVSFADGYTFSRPNPAVLQVDEQG